MSYSPGRHVAASAPSRRDVRRAGLGTFLGRTLLGTVLPGSGLLLSGVRTTGGTLLALFVGGVVAVALFVASDGFEAAFLPFAVSPRGMLVLTGLLVVIVLVWVGSVVWTATLNWPSRPATGKRIVAGVVVTLACLALLAPAARAVQYVVISRGVVDTLFQASPRVGVGPDVGAADAWAAVPRVNVLLVGADSEPDREGLRTDSMMLASIDTATGDTVLFGLPRNLENAPFPATSPMRQLWPDGYNCGDDCLLNDVWGQAEAHPELYPGDPRPGLTALSESVGEITGLYPDYGVVVNMAGFQSLVDAMGGVEITVKDRVPIGGKVAGGQIVPGSIRGWIEPGQQRLDGYHAMWYARGRATTNDFDRMKRQRCMVGALLDQANPALMLERYPEIAQVAKDNLYTSIPAEHLSAWAFLATRMQHGTIRSLPFNDEIIDVGRPDFAHMREIVQTALLDLPMPTPTTTDDAPAAFAPGAPTSDDGAPTSSSPATPLAPPATPATPTPPGAGLVDVDAAC